MLIFVFFFVQLSLAFQSSSAFRTDFSDNNYASIRHESPNGEEVHWVRRGDDFTFKFRGHRNFKHLLLEEVNSGSREYFFPLNRRLRIERNGRHTKVILKIQPDHRITLFKGEVLYAGHRTNFHLFILANPFNVEDETYMNDASERDEYLFGEYGLKNRNRFWKHDQHSKWTTLVMMKLMSKIRSAPGSSQLLRELARFVNSKGDSSGIVQGKWKGSYSKGVSPLVWTRSKQILKDYVLNGYKRVKYGQCWVFSGVLTTLCRYLGIPARMVMNSGSAHTSPRDRTVDLFYSRGKRINNLSDSSWNFHSWTEAHISRRDLGTVLGIDYSVPLWQVIDGTPQEQSGGYYRLGPIPVPMVHQYNILRRLQKAGYYRVDDAIEKLKKQRWDLNFVANQVDADVRRFDLKRGLKLPKSITENNITEELIYKFFKLRSITSTTVGKAVLTKSLGSKRTNVITLSYKDKEGYTRPLSRLPKALADFIG